MFEKPVDVADLKPLFHIQKALWNKPYNILLVYFGNMPAMQLFKFIQIKRVFLFSIFFLPRLPFAANTGLRYLLADLATALCACVLSLKYWRHIWRTR